MHEHTVFSVLNSTSILCECASAASVFYACRLALVNLYNFIFLPDSFFFFHFAIVVATAFFSLYFVTVLRTNLELLFDYISFSLPFFNALKLNE